MNIHTPQGAVDALYADPDLPNGPDERFSGYGVMGIPFASGHYLAMRDMLASSIGPAYTTIWHRDPHGHWTIHTNAAPEVSCPRYFGAGATVQTAGRIDVSWIDESVLDVTLEDEVYWRIEVSASPATTVMTAMSSAMPTRAWTSRTVLGSMGPMAAVMLRSGRVRLCGRTPNGQTFKAAPLQVWRVAASSATYRGEDLGTPAPLAEQARLGDLWLPQRGIFFVGRARFTPGDTAHDAGTTSHAEAAR